MALRRAARAQGQEFLHMVQLRDGVEGSVMVAGPDEGERDQGLANDSRNAVGVNKAVVRLVFSADTWCSLVLFTIILAG